MPLDLTTEKTFWSQGINITAGADEVGRGSFAGPVVAAAVIFSKTHQPIPGINDSKLLSPSMRLGLAHLIKKQAKHFAIGQASVKIINAHGISAAVTFALDQALKQTSSLNHLLFDGHHKPSLKSLIPSQITTVTKGDQTCYSIAAASIIAKVHRDELMQKLHLRYPQYDWLSNKGYGTPSHRAALIKHGPSPYHRRQFIQKTLANFL